MTAKPTTIDAYHAAQSNTDAAICDSLRAAIDTSLPDATSKIWHGHPVWFLEGNPIVGYGKLKDCVRLLFWSGQSFPGTDLHPEGKFKAAELRYADPAEVDPAQLARLLVHGREIQWDYKNIVKRKGRLEPLTPAASPF